MVFFRVEKTDGDVIVDGELALRQAVQAAKAAGTFTRIRLACGCPACRIVEVVIASSTTFRREKKREA